MDEQFTFPSGFRVDDRLAHLTLSEISSMMHAYIDRDPVAKILKEHQVSGAIRNGLCGVFPPVESSQVCRYCKCHMHQRLLTRSSKKSRLGSPVCPRCNHTYIDKSDNPLKQFDCTCDNCLRVRESHMQKRVKFVKQMLTLRLDHSRAAPVEVNQLSFIQSVTMYALCSRNEFANSTTIESIEHKTEEDLQFFAPTNELATQVIDELLRENVIALSPNTPITAFTDDTSLQLANVTKAVFELNCSYNGKMITVEQAIPLLALRIAHPIVENDAESVKKWLFELGCAELIGLSNWLHTVFNTGIRPTPEFEQHLHTFLTEHSISQGWDLINKIYDRLIRSPGCSKVLESDDQQDQFTDTFFQSVHSGQLLLESAPRETPYSDLQRILDQHICLSEEFITKVPLRQVWDKKFAHRIQSENPPGDSL